MDTTTLRYVQQFGRSKRDNLKPSLMSKYQVGQRIEVYPFRIMDFGCFATTTDGLSGLIHNSEMPSVLQSSLPEMIEKAVPLHVKINKFDRRTGEIAFILEDKESTAAKVATVASVPTEPQTEAPFAPAVPAETAPEETAPVADASVTAPTTAQADSGKPAEGKPPEELVPFQFTTSRPVYEEPAKDAYTERMNQETADIQKFLETVIRTPLSAAAQKMLRELLEQSSIFRFTYTMQTVVDEFEADPGLQLLTAIDRQLHQPKK